MENNKIINPPVTQLQGEIVYEVSCYYIYDSPYPIGIFDTREKALAAKEQFLKEVEEEKAKYPCPLPKFKKKFLENKWLDNEAQSDRMHDWFYNTPMHELESIVGVFITEIELNKYNFLPNLREE